VFGFGITQASLHLATADLWLLAAVGSAAFGYGEGARLTRRLGGWRVISWALVLTLPLTLALSLLALAQHPLTATVSWRAWLGFAYVGVVSMYLAYFAWYAGLTRTTVARASQVQLAQPVLGLFWSWLLLAEKVSPAMLVTAGFVLISAAAASRARVRSTTASHLPAGRVTPRIS
jgi:drug/metabolite transporter (DMT)-like permease